MLIGCDGAASHGAGSRKQDISRTDAVQGSEILCSVCWEVIRLTNIDEPWLNASDIENWDAITSCTAQLGY